MTQAIDKHSCPACGSQAEWNPGKQALVCPYCGTVSPYEVDAASGEVRELDLVRALREIPDELRGWQTNSHSVQCKSCKAVSVFEAGRVGQRCDFCGSPELVDYNEVKAPLRPQSLLPFKTAQDQAKNALRQWYSSKRLAPGSLKRQALLDDAHGAYLPYWTFDANVECPWTAEAGHYYTTSERVRDPQGRMVTRQVQKVRWSPASGQVHHTFDDTLVPGSHGVEHSILTSIEPFPTQQLIPYDTSYLSGFVVEHYQQVLVDAAQAARRRMEGTLRQLCGSQVPGDTQRNLQIFPRYSGETFKLVLLPVWLLTYRYRGKVYQVVVNGVTGQVGGRYPKSAWKIFFLVLLLLIVAGFLAYWVANNQ